MPRVCGLCGSSGRFHAGVVLAVNGDPLLGDHAGREPQPEAEEMADGGVELERAMGLRAVQEDRHTGDRDVREGQRHDEVPPPRKGHQAVRDEAEKIEGHQQSFVFGLPQAGNACGDVQANRRIIRESGSSRLVGRKRFFALEQEVGDEIGDPRESSGRNAFRWGFARPPVTWRGPASPGASAAPGAPSGGVTRRNSRCADAILTAVRAKRRPRWPG